MKNLYLIFTSVFIFCNTLNAQETVDLAQLFLGITGVGGSEVVYHTITAEGKVWEKTGNNYITSENEDVYASTMYSTGNFSSFNVTRAPFNWVWLSQQGRVSPWGLGLYKITNSKVSGKYFYLDTRDNEYVETSINPDLFFVYQSDSAKYQCIIKCNNFIENGSLVRVSDILGFTSKTHKLENFWSNALVSLNSNNHPRLIWGRYPDASVTINNYKVYRKYGSSSWQLHTTVPSNKYEYTDGSVTLNSSQQSGTDVQYKVTAIYNTSNETSASNIVTVNVRGSEIEKNGLTEVFDLNEFGLEQNYPNPFNPSTRISFSIKEMSFVSLKIHDVLGNEISELVGEVKESGTYSVSFDASKLSSGIYFYTLKARGNSITNKMLLAK